jgi:hypothetical protein
LPVGCALGHGARWVADAADEFGRRSSSLRRVATAPAGSSQGRWEPPNDVDRGAIALLAEILRARRLKLKRPKYRLNSRPAVMAASAQGLCVIYPAVTRLFGLVRFQGARKMLESLRLGA